MTTIILIAIKAIPLITFSQDRQKQKDQLLDSRIEDRAVRGLFDNDNDDQGDLNASIMVYKTSFLTQVFGFDCKIERKQFGEQMK